MEEKEFAKRFKEEIEVYREESSWVNPLEVFEGYYFRKGAKDMSYRDEALNRCIDERTDFSFTHNNKNNIIKNFISVTCPECKSNMEILYSSTYKCKCGNKVTISLNDFDFTFSKKTLG